MFRFASYGVFVAWLTFSSHLFSFTKLLFGLGIVIQDTKYVHTCSLLETVLSKMCGVDQVCRIQSSDLEQDY